MKIAEILHDRASTIEFHTVLQPKSRWAAGKIVQWMGLQGKLCGVQVTTHPAGDSLRVSVKGSQRNVENFQSSSHEIAGYIDRDAEEAPPDVPRLFPRAGD